MRIPGGPQVGPAAAALGLGAHPPARAATDETCCGTALPMGRWPGEEGAGRPRGHRRARTPAALPARFPKHLLQDLADLRKVRLKFAPEQKTGFCRKRGSAENGVLQIPSQIPTPVLNIEIGQLESALSFGGR